MEIVINIPEKEFGIDIDNKFKDFFSRLKVEIKEHLITNTNLVCGAYELETIDMFLKAFSDSVPLPKGHGRIVDERKITKCQQTGLYIIDGNVSKCLITDAPTIIEAESEV